MVARLPDANALGGLPSARSGAPIVRYDTSAQWQGLANFGDAIQKASVAVETNWNGVTANESEAKFQSFKFEEAKRYDDAVRTTQAGAAKGFADNYSKGYFDRAKAFLSTLPADQHPEYDGKLFQVEQSLYSDGLTFERGEQKRAALNTLDDSVRNTILPKVEMAAKLPADDPRKVALLAEAKADARKQLDANPALTDIQRDRLWSGETDENGNYKPGMSSRIEEAFGRALPAEEQALLDPAAATETVGDRMRFVETGGNPEARPRDPKTGELRSTAAGPDGFLRGTWLGLIKKYRPDLTEGRSPDELLALRADADLSGEMRDHYMQENAATLTGRGYAATPGNLYLAHFLGPGGAVAMLGAEPVMAAADLNPAAANANPEVFYREDKDGTPDMTRPRSVAEILQWANARMAGTRVIDYSRVLTAVPYETRLTIATDGGAALLKQEADRKQQAQAAYDANLIAAQNGIQDGTFNLVDLDHAYDGGNGWLAPNPKDRLMLNEQIQKRDKETLSYAGAVSKVQDPNYVFNAWDKGDVDATDLIYDKGNYKAGAGLLEGDPNAVTGLKGVVDRTGIVPSSAVALLQSGIRSSDNKRMEGAFTIMDGLYRANPQAVEKFFDEKDIARLQDYEQLADILPPNELQQRMNPALNPEEAKRRADLRTVGAKLAANVSTDDIVSFFDPSTFGVQWTRGPNAHLTGDEPALAADPQTVLALRQDFDALFAERYSITGDEKVAKQQALDRLKLKWGSTAVGSRNYLMQYPPENFYPEVNGSHDWMDDQLADFVEARLPGAQDWFPVALPETEADIAVKKSGGNAQPRYAVGAIDKDGVFHLLSNPASGAPTVVVFDTALAQQQARERFDQRRNSIAADQILNEVQGMMGSSGQAAPSAIIENFGARLDAAGQAATAAKPIGNGPRIGGPQ